jgi:hypothetical protein
MLTLTEASSGVTANAIAHPRERRQLRRIESDGCACNENSLVTSF